MNLRGSGSLVAVGLAGVAIAGLVTVVIVTNDTPDTTTSATFSSRTEEKADPCVDDDVPHDDDIGAREGLLQNSQLPAGDWTTRATSACRWSLSSQDLLAIPACASGAGDSEVLEIEHTANARSSWIQAGTRVRLDDRVEFYPGREKPDAFRALLAGPGVADCFEAAVRRQAKRAPAVTVDAIEVSSYDLGFTPTELGEVPNLESVQGVQITFTTTDDGEPEPVTIRVMSYGGGGVVGILTVIGTGADADPPVLDALDLPTVVRTAAAHLLSMF